MEGEEGEGEAVGGVDGSRVGGVAFGQFEPEAAIGRGQAAEHGGDTAASGLDGFGATMPGPACVFGQEVDGVHVGAHAAVVEQPIGPLAGQGGVDHALDARLLHAQGPEQVERQVAVAAHGPAQLDVRPVPMKPVAGSRRDSM